MDQFRVYLETGKRWVFAGAVDWPGWCRRDKSEQAALDTLCAYGERYANAVGGAAPAAKIVVAGSMPTRGGMADFGTPGAIGPWDETPLSASELDRQLALLQACWAYLGAVDASSPARLRKGPRGGGRDKDAILDHVREAERAYAAKFGCRVPPRTPWDDQQSLLVAGVRAAPSGTAWPIRYAIRRLAWHVLDHAWEIEDRSG